VTRPPAPPPKRTPPVVWVLGGLVVLAMVGLAFVLYDRHGPGPVGSGARGFTVLSDTQVSISWDVSMTPGRTAACLVRARDVTGAEAGSSIVRVGPSTRRTLTATYVLPTTARANTGELIACEPAQPGRDEDAPVASVAP
jgi:Domain of unknown function (DUF4307)